jgi:hypothetical protein
MTGRPYTKADYLAIKTAFKLDCEDCGSLALVAEYTRVDKTLLSRYGNPNQPEFPPLDVVLDVGALSGGDRTLKEMARLRGYDLTKDERGVAIESPVQHAGTISKEVGEAIVALSDVIRKPTPTNAAKAARELHDVREVVELATDDMHRIQAGDRA